MLQDSLIPSVQRTLTLLEMLRAQPDGLSLQDLLANLDISRSSLFDLLNTLKQLGYIEQVEKRGRYHAGPRLQAWNQPALMPQQDQLSAFYHEATTAPNEETLAFAVPVADGSLIVAQAESSHRVRSVYVIGQVYDPSACAAFHILHTPSPSVREYGYALRQDDDSTELAFPVCRDGLHPDAALLFSAPTFRCTDALIEHNLPLLREMAARLSYRLGALTYQPYQRQAHADPGLTMPLQPEQISSFLKGPWTARLACVRSSHIPHVVPVWQEWDGQDFYIVAWSGSLWAEYVLAHPHVSLTVDEPWPPLRRVTAHGTAYPLSEADINVDQLSKRLRQRYLGGSPSLSAAPPITHAFRIRPEMVRGWQGMPRR